MNTFWQDVRFGLRMMAKAPGFTAVAVLSLALGIGANTALFSLVDAVLLKSLPVQEPERLVVFNWQAGRAFRLTGQRGVFVRGSAPPGMRGGSSFKTSLFEQMRAEQQRDANSPLSDLFAFAWLGEVNALVNGQAEVAKAQVVSGGYFAGLGVKPALGRAITEGDDDPAAPPAVVLSHRYWQERWRGDTGVIGKQISLNGAGFTVIGVLPANFSSAGQVDQRPDVIAPLAFEPVIESSRPMVDQPNQPAPWWLNVMGRLRPGATMEQARASLDSAFQAKALEIMPPPRKTGEPAQLEPKDFPHLVARPGRQGMWEIRSMFAKSIYLLFGVVGLVLLIACANVANLLLARAALRGPEIAVRLAVGAGRGRLMRQLLTESLLLSTLGGAVGVVFALWGKDALAALGGRGSFLPEEIAYRLDWRVLGFTLGVALLTGVLFGIAPAWRATKPDLNAALKESNRSAGGAARSRLTKGLIITQVALSLVLLMGAGLFLRTLRNLQQVDVGFNQENLLLFTLQPQTNGYKGERLIEFYRQVFARLDALPGARSVTFAHIPLVAYNIDNNTLLLPGETPQTAQEHVTNRLVVRENFLGAMEIPLLRGRAFNERDDEIAPRVAIINETFAQKFFPGQDPIGQRVGLDAETAGKIEIIGITRDIKYNSQREDREPLLYTPWRQEPAALGQMYFSLRAMGEPTALTSAVRAAVRAVDANLPLVDVTTQVARTNETLREERIYATLLGFFAALALLLAAIGLYSVLAYSVAQRTRELGVRIALGARASDVLRLVVWQGMKLVLAGVALGAFGAFALKKLVASRLYGVGAADPLTFAAVSACLLLVALAACWLPARRAAQVDPMVALRNE